MEAPIIVAIIAGSVALGGSTITAGVAVAGGHTGAWLPRQRQTGL